ncbi:TetR/AcrR family transcriptional regulator [Humitalea sp. 24SJ18S-53]|uniref:TetR/AcrR family transcriptional regulator n=1 Tax=Humitalea sp. 24SJ18S-53 TaxID=3422307 RepID=UPI003D663E0B
MTAIASATIEAAESATRRRLTEADRRLELVRVAEDVFLAQGYTAANMDDVARGARMSKKTLYQIFASKAALFEAVIADHLAPLKASAPEEQGDDPRAALTTLLEMAARHLLERRQIGIFRLISAEGKRAPELAEAFHRAGPGGGEGSLERCIAAHARRGHLRVEDPGEAASMLFGMAIGKMHMMLLLGLRQQPEAEEIASMVARAVDIFLRGTLLPSVA